MMTLAPLNKPSIEAFSIFLYTIAVVLLGVSLRHVFVAKRARWMQRNPEQTVHLDLQAIEPHRHPAFNLKGKYQMAMGIKNMDMGKWLTVDRTYIAQHTARSKILMNKKDKVVQCLPGSEDACIEVLELVIEFLTGKYSAMYKIVEDADLVKRLKNCETGEIFRIEPPFGGLLPLEIAARLVNEDFNIVEKAPGGKEHRLYSSPFGRSFTPCSLN